ncbi:hypothetical protein GCM10027427_35230 [Pseudoclavibacter terrae]
MISNQNTEYLQSFLWLLARPGKLSAVVDEYRTTRIIEAAGSYGLLRGELIIWDTDSRRLLITSLWDSEASYESWLQSSERVVVTRHLHTLLDESEGMRVEVGHIREEVEISTRPIPLTAEVREGCRVVHSVK